MKNVFNLALVVFLSSEINGAVIYHSGDISIGTIPGSPSSPIQEDFDVNGDGTVDLTLDVTLRALPREFTFWAGGQSSGGVITITNIEIGQFGVASLPKDFEIGSNLGDAAMEFTLFSTQNPLPIVTTNSIPEGPFYQNPGYLGFQFEAADGVHFGYIYLEEVQSLSAIYHGFAYESEPNTPILAGAIPEPSSVLLVFLASGLLVGRRLRSRE